MLLLLCQTALPSSDGFFFFLTLLNTLDSVKGFGRQNAEFCYAERGKQAANEE